jgi:6-phosphofructokinase 1
MKGNAVIGQSGGPTAVINSSLVGVAEACLEDSRISHVLGMRFGIEGFMHSNLVDLGRISREGFAKLKRTPSSALASCRHKLKDSDLPGILDVLKKNDIRYFFLIGGNDTMGTIFRIEQYCREHSYTLFGIGIPKTVDNDLYGTDHTPGYPSAARYVALSVLQTSRWLRDMRKVDTYVVHQTVGRDTGWLAAASALARTPSGGAPHLIYLPERRVSPESIIADAQACFNTHGWCYIVCGEGVLWQNGHPVSSSSTQDRFSNVEFGAAGGSSAALTIHALIREATGRRGEFQIPESMSMCADDRVPDLDLEEAYACGRWAAQLAHGGKSSVMVTIQRAAGLEYASSCGEIALSEVAARAKPMAQDLFVVDAPNVSPKFLDYAGPLVGELPEYFDIE